MHDNKPEKDTKDLPLCTCGKTQDKPYCDGSCDLEEDISK